MCGFRLHLICIHNHSRNSNVVRWKTQMTSAVRSAHSFAKYANERGTRRLGRVIKIAIDKRARGSENKGHEERLAGVVPASGRLRGEEAAGCSDPASNTEPAATAHCRTHRTLCSRQAGKCQHGNLQLSARDHRDRFQNGAHQASLQENERGKMRRTADWRAGIMCL